MDIGCHGLVWTNSWDAHGITHAIDGTVRAGYSRIELPLLDPDSFDAEAARQKLADTGIAASGGLTMIDGADISSADPEVVARGEARLMQGLDLLHRVGGTHFVGMPYGQLKRFSSVPTPRERENTLAPLRRVADRAQDLGIRMGLEVVNRYESSLFNTAAECLDYLDEIGHSNIGVHLDTYHMNIEEDDLTAAIVSCGRRLSYVHLGENNRGVLGAGLIDFAEIASALSQIGFDGPLVFESFTASAANDEIAEFLAVWRDPWNDSFQAAKASREEIARVFGA